MKSNRINRSLANAAGILAIALLSGQTVLADSLQWGGQSTASANWSDAGNWTNSALANAAPAAGDDLTFFNQNQQLSANDLVGATINSLTYRQGGYDFTGNPLAIINGITNTANAGANIFDLPLPLTAAQTWEIDGGSLTLNNAITNSAGLTLFTTNTSASTSVSWLETNSVGVPARGLFGAGNLVVGSNVTVSVSGGFIYGTGITGPNFAGNTFINGIVSWGAGCFDGNSPIGQSVTINPGGSLTTTAAHVCGSSGRPLSIYGGTLDMESEAYFTTVTLSNATLTTGATKDLRGNGSFTNLASAGTTTFGVALNLTSSRVIGVDLGSASPDIDFTGNGTWAIQGSGTLTKVGPGVMRISGVDNHTGPTIISAGTLALTGSMPAPPSITIASNAVFDISGTSFSLNTNQTLQGVGTVIGTLNDYNAVPGAVLSPGGNNAAGTLTMDGLSLGGNVTLNFDLANSVAIGGGTNDLLIVTNFSANAGVTNVVNISFVNGTPVVGTAYTLIKYGNGFAGDPATFLTAAASRYVYTFVNNTTLGAIQVVVTGTPGNLVWKGDGVTNAWDVAGTTNWFNGASKDVFLQGDNATFSDIGSNTPLVSLTASVQPTTVTVNATKSYVLGGSGKITGGAKLLKSNSGNLTLLGANDFTGGGGLNGTGIVTVGNGGNAAGLGAGVLTNNTKVIFYQNTSSTYAGNMTGTGSVTAFTPGATLTLTGTNTFTGGLVVANGTVQIGNNTAGVSPSVAGNITNYATLNIYRADAFTNKNTITAAGNSLEYGNGDINVRGVGGMTVDGSGSISTLPAGSLSIAQSANGLMNVNTGAVINIGANLLLGNPTSSAGIVNQTGGTINVGNQVRIGHWGTELSTYNMFGGILNVPNNQLGVGWDGVGIMTVSNGMINCRTLNVDDNGITGAIATSNSTLYVFGGTINIGSGGIGGAIQTNAVLPTILLSGGTIGTLQPAAYAPAGWSSVMNLRLTNGSPTFDSSNSIITLNGVLSGNGGLIKQGSGYLTLNATNTFTNTTTVAAGTLQGNGITVSPIVVQSGANLSGGSTLTVGTLTASNVTMNAGATLVVDASSTTATNDLIFAKGALALDTATPMVFNFLGGTPYTGGAYTVVSNLLTRTGHLVVAPSSLTRYTATVDESNPNRVQVSFTGTNASLVWNGGVSTNWNINTEANWLNAGMADKFYQSDAVVFDDTGIAKSNINVAATVTPAKITVDTAGNYTLTGSSISGLGALVKSGTGKLTLVNSNNYTGGTTIAGGTLQIGNGGASGYILGTVGDYGNLTFNESGTAIFNGTINGPGTLTQAGTGTLLITATQNHYGGSTVNPGSTVQLGNGALADAGSLGNGIVTNNGTVVFYRLSSIGVATPYTGAGSLIFQGTGNAAQSAYALNATNTFTGPVTLNYARIQSGAGAQSLGNPSSITVNPGSQVYAVSTPVSSLYTMPLTLAGTGWQDGLGALRIENIGNWAGNITLAANARIGVNNATTNTIAGNITGNYELETYGGNAAAGLVLAPSAANTYAALRVSIGTAGAKTIAGNNAAIPNNIPLTMNGGTLWLNGFSKSFNPFLNLSSSSSLQNGSTTTPASVTLAPLVGNTTYSGTFADGATQPLNVTLTQTPGLWATAFTTASPNWTGSLTNNGGTISNGVQNTAFGSQGVIGRSIVGNNGATFVTTINNALNGYAGNVVLNNSTFITTRYISFNAPGSIYLANSKLDGTNSTDGGPYYSWGLPATVTVRGSVPSYMNGSGTGAGYDLASIQTTFDVADATGNSAADLLIGAPVRNSSGGGNGSLAKTGAGTLELDAANTYSGATVITAGTLALGASGSITSPTISIASGAALDGSAVPGGYALANNQTLTGSGSVVGSLTDASASIIAPGTLGTAGTLTITTNFTLTGNGSLAIDLAATTTVGGGVNDLIKVNGNLTLSSANPTPVTFNFLGGVPATGSAYTLIQCSGTLTGTPATAFTNALNARYTAVFSQVGNNVVVTFSGSASNLVWTGTDPLTAATWDVATSTNWNNGATGDIFYAGDTVKFDDTSAVTNVTVNTTVTPGTVSVNTTNAYTLSGSGAIAGYTSIAKSGPGSLTLNLADTFAGPVNVGTGKLLLAGTSPLGAAANVITVSNGAALDFNGDSMGSSATRAYTYVAGGSGPDGNGAIVNNGGSIFSYANVSNLTLTANTVINASNRWDIGPIANSTVNGNGFNLVKIGPGQVDMRPQYITNLASITVSNGTMYYESSYPQTNAATLATTNYIAPGAILGVYASEILNMPVVVNGGTLQNQNATTPAAVWTGNIVVSNSSVFSSAGPQNFLGVIAGPGAITVGGFNSTTGAIPATLTFSNANTFTGGITLSNAPVTIGHTAAVGGYAAIVLTSSNGLGSGPINLNLSLMNTNTATNTVRALECNVQNGGVVPNPIILPAATTTVTNMSIQGRDSSSVFTLAGQITGGYAGLTNWVDFGDSGSSGVLRLANNANTFTAATYVDRGVLAITGDGCLGNSANTLFLDTASANGGLRFDATGITIAHNIIWNTASTISVYGDDSGIGYPQTANNVTISGNIAGITAGQGLVVGGGTNIAGTSYGTLTLTGSNTYNSQITINAYTKLVAGSTNALGGTGYYGIVASGGTLSLANVGAFVNRQIQFSGPGVLIGGAGVGALENLAGTNVYSASLSMNAASSFGVTAGSLTLSAGISGAYPLTKVGPGPLILSATETYTAGTYVNAGTLILNGSLPVGNFVNVAYGTTLGGSGTFNCPVSVQFDGTFQPGAGGATVGKCTVNGPLNLGGNTVMFLNKAAPTNSQIAGISTVIYGGTLNVTNLGGTLTLGDKFTLFSAMSRQGVFTTLNLPALPAGLGWSNSLAIDGSIQVVTAVSTTPPVMTNTLSGSTLTLSWPTDHLGWRLQVQTNDLTSGITTNWFTWPNSTNLTSVPVQVDPAQPTVFFRLVYP